MSKVSATASLGIKKGLGHKKGFNQYDNASPHHSITIERQYDDNLTDEELVEKADQLHAKARALVEKKIQADMKDINGSD